MNDNKIKIPLARLKEIIQEEVSNFYGIQQEEMLEEEEVDEVLTPDQEKQRDLGAAMEKLNMLPPDQAKVAIAKMGLK